MKRNKIISIVAIIAAIVACSTVCFKLGEKQNAYQTKELCDTWVLSLCDNAADSIEQHLATGDEEKRQKSASMIITARELMYILENVENLSQLDMLFGRMITDLFSEEDYSEMIYILRDIAKNYPDAWAKLKMHLIHDQFVEVSNEE